MRTISIRDLSGTEIAKAAKQHEVLGITNAGLLCGVLIPVDQAWVHNLVEWNFSRVVRSVEDGEKALTNGELVQTLEEALIGPSQESLEQPRVVSVSIRDIKGSMIIEAGERRQSLWITNGRALCGILVPVTPEWVQRLIEQNLTRVIFNIERGEKELITGQALPTATETMTESAPMT